MHLDTQEAQKGLHPAHGPQPPVSSPAGRALSLSPCQGSPGRLCNAVTLLDVCGKHRLELREQWREHPQPVSPRV